MKNEHDNYMKDNISLVSRLKGNLRALRMASKLFEGLCVNCRIIAYNDPKFDISELCDKCKPVFEKKLKKLGKVVGGDWKWG